MPQLPELLSAVSELPQSDLPELSDLHVLPDPATPECSDLPEPETELEPELEPELSRLSDLPEMPEPDLHWLPALWKQDMRLWLAHMSRWKEGRQKPGVTHEAGKQ